MKLARSQLRCSTYSLPELRFEDQDLTSFSGLVFFHKLLLKLGVKDRLRACVRHLNSTASYAPATLLLLLVVHLALGWRRLRDLDYYRKDPLVLRLLGLRRLPDVSTLTRGLHGMDQGVVEGHAELSRSLVLSRVLSLGSQAVTLDFDGSVLSTKSRGTEGTAVGFNKKSKGQRSYYPLLATVAQTGQVLDVLHRPGNVHDSKEAVAFAESCFHTVRDAGFGGRLEARLDSAHFSDRMCFWLNDEGIEYSISVPFERFAELKELIENRRRWRRIDETWSCFECGWLPKSWRGIRGARQLRVLLYRQRVKTPRQGPIQLDLFVPIDRHYEFKVVITNKCCSPRGVLLFHHGRGSQEGVFAELKSQAAADYIPTRRLLANQLYLQSAILALNLHRELQMQLLPPPRRNTLKRACLWTFERIGTFRKRVVQRAGRLTRPGGVLTLTVAGDRNTEAEFLQCLASL